MPTFELNKQQLQGELAELSDEINKLRGLDDEIRRIIELIKVRQGWTTPVEGYLVSSMVASLKTQVAGFHALSAALINGSHAIDVEEKPVELRVMAGRKG